MFSNDCKHQMSDNSSENEGNNSSDILECNECDSTQVKKCKVCDETLCPKHLTGYLKEWLIYNGEMCAKCRRSGCPNCMITCFSCANQGDQTYWYCDSCNEEHDILTTVDCKYHLWYKCDEKHDHCQDDECPECGSNRNYAGRMEW